MSESYVRTLFAEAIETKRRAAPLLAGPVAAAGALIAARLSLGGKLLACGNGGSAADAQHLAAELVNRFEHPRRALPAIAITTDSSNLTSIANDDRFDAVFARQVEALGVAGDVLVAITTSGNSPSISNAIGVARGRGLAIVLLSGRDGGEAATCLGESDIEIRVPSSSTARIQEVHILVLHCLCGIIDERFGEHLT